MRQCQAIRSVPDDGKRLAELRMLGRRAAQYRQTFESYSVRSLFGAQLGYAVLTLLAATWLFATERPHLLATLSLMAGVLAWTFKMTFEPDSPLIDPAHLYRRKLFLLLMLVTFAVVAGWARCEAEATMSVLVTGGLRELVVWSREAVDRVDQATEALRPRGLA